MALKRAVWKVWAKQCSDLSTLPTDAAGQLDVLGHDGHPLGMDGAQVGVLEETDQVSFRCLLQGHHGGALESQICLEILGNFTDQALEWQLSDQQLCALLVTTDLTESHCTWPVPVGLLHTTSGWCTLTSCLGGQLLPGGLASSRFSGCLLCTCHDNSLLCCAVSSTDENAIMRRPVFQARSLTQAEAILKGQQPVIGQLKVESKLLIGSVRMDRKLTTHRQAASFPPKWGIVGPKPRPLPRRSIRFFREICHIEITHSNPEFCAFTSVPCLPVYPKPFFLHVDHSWPLFLELRIHCR